MINLGWALTGYVCLSFILFMATSFTITGWIIYLFLLLPFYALVLLVWWLYAWSNRKRTARVRYWVWGLVLALQIATILTSPGNCYGIKGGGRCYSNLQILFGGIPGSGPSNLPHWKVAEDAFPGMLAAYGVGVVIGLATVSRGAMIDKTGHNSG